MALLRYLINRFVGLVPPYLQMVLFARGPHHVPLATRLLWDPVVAEATAYFIIQILRQVFRQVAGALASCDRGDHPKVW